MIIETGTLAVIDRVNPDNQALELLVGVQKRGAWQNHLNFVGGKIDHELPKDGAIREIAEETGIRLAPQQLRALGRIVIIDKRPGSGATESVAVYGASIESSTPIVPNEDEIDCFWINPTDKNVLLSMPLDVRYWLPVAYSSASGLFTCTRSIDTRGGESIHMLVEDATDIHRTSKWSGNLTAPLAPLMPIPVTS